MCVYTVCQELYEFTNAVATMNCFYIVCNAINF